MSRRTRKTVAKSASFNAKERKRRKEKAKQLKKRLRPKLRPNTERIAAQIECHRVFDRLWCGPDAVMSRPAAYRYLAAIMECHISRAHIRLLDILDCRRAIARIQREYPDLFSRSA